MKPHTFIIIGLILSALTLYSFTSSQTSRQVLFPLADTTKSYLTLYGQYVFNREKCYNCHSLNQEGKNKLISLDGLKNKYPKNWHYLHLVDPALVVPNSTMPSFAFLTVNLFSKDSIDKNIRKISPDEWNKQLSEAKLINSELNSFDVEDNSEMIALISFLDNIEESEKLKVFRGKEREKIAIENKIRDSLWGNSDYIINTSINEKSSSKKGQEIFTSYCTPCHGKQGEGSIGPNLTDNYWLHGGSNKNIANTIINGVPDKGMISWRYELTPSEVGYLVSYINSIKGTDPPYAKSPQGIKE